MDSKKAPEENYVGSLGAIRFTNHVEIPAGGEYKFEVDTNEALRKDEDFQTLRGQIINSSLFIEEKIDYIIAKLLFSQNFEKADLFKSIVLSREFFNFMNKKKVLKDLLSSISPFSTRDYHELYRSIQKIIDERNKFAHGQVSYSGNKGEKIFIKYFNDGLVNEELTLEVANSFMECEDICNKELTKIMAELNPTSQNPK